jgi:hypothetical protein
METKDFGNKYIVLLHVKMILRSDHKFPVDILDFKTEHINF